MKILPPQTQPSPSAIGRRHQPLPGNYPSYVPCLRWDFGFSCAFCLLHEGDLFPLGIRGTGLMWVEHRALRKDDPEKADQYANCAYSCRFCNQSRATRAVKDRRGGSLLDPTLVAWGERFSIKDDRMAVRDEDDPDAVYTYAAYDLGDPRKTELRRNRREWIEESRRDLQEICRIRSRLLERASRQPRPAIAASLRARALQLELHVSTSLERLRRFRAVPGDAPGECACAEGRHRTIPEYLEAQCWECPDNP